MLRQTGLFGGVVPIQSKAKASKKNGGAKHPNPWDGICVEACWYAREKRCVCRCGGRHHGKGRNGHEEKLEKFSSPKKERLHET